MPSPLTLLVSGVCLDLLSTPALCQVSFLTPATLEAVFFMSHVLGCEDPSPGDTHLAAVPLQLSLSLWL